MKRVVIVLAMLAVLLTGCAQVEQWTDAGKEYLAANQRTSGQVRAIAAMRIDGLREWLEDAMSETRDGAQQAHLRYAYEQIGRFQEEPGDFEYYEPVEPPAGSPIGDGRFGCDWE